MAGRVVIIVGVILVGLGLYYRRAKPEVPIQPVSDWSGTWVSEAWVVRFRYEGGLKGDFTDGETVASFRPRLSGDVAVWKAVLRGRPWTLYLTRDGDTARLVGVQEVAPDARPIVITRSSPDERAEEAARRREENRRALLPVDFGVFRRQ